MESYNIESVVAAARQASGQYFSEFINDATSQSAEQYISQMFAGGSAVESSEIESTVAAAVEAGMPRKATWSADSVEQLLESLPDLLQEGDTVLVKGARRARMERVVERFCRVEC